ncbi:MAG: response regulator [Opitutae bacterium]|nr:response regulator [Opitutae bacterium]
MRDSSSLSPAPSDPSRRNAVLLLEDNEIIASMLTALLKSMSLRVIWCADGASAERVFAERHGEVLLVLADCRLPDVDGRDVCARFRTRIPELPVLVTSGSVSGRGVAPLERNRLVEYLPKPYAPSEVLTRVRRLMDAASSAGPLNTGMV